MLRGLQFGVVLTLLLTVLTVQIAPTVDLPETTLRDHRVVSSHSSGEHASGGFTIVSSAPRLQWRTLDKEKSPSSESQSSDRTRFPSSLVLRC
jgi:hypothetical protein